MKELKDYIKIASDFLNKENTSSKYFSDKTKIDDFFKNTKNEYDDIFRRLIIVDSLYSTNMSKRYFGIEEIAQKIYEIGDDIIKEIDNYKDSESKIDSLLKGVYGINKKGNPCGEARSLISKYLYFVSKHNFPIEDSLVKGNVNEVLTCFEGNKIDTENNFFRSVIKYCSSNNITVEEFDNLFWLLGKLKKGSLSMLTNKEDYIDIIRLLDIKSNKSSEIDDETAKKLQESIFISKIEKYLPREILELNKKIHDSNKKEKSLNK